jgi:hypothetical protein
MFSQHSPLPGIKGRKHVGQKPQGIEGRQEGNAEQISKGEKHKKIMPGKLLMPGRLLNLKISHAHEEIMEKFF